MKGIIGMHRFNICLVLLSLCCSGVKTPLDFKDRQVLSVKMALYLVEWRHVCVGVGGGGISETLF